ncbi:MAG: hypothetical protein R3244_00085 [Thermoanaerobaculia bacterium]|nr:hypothetical protein [Thermoanaerobaculia bacterium]
MTVKKIVALILIAGGVLALVYGGFSYTKEEHGVRLGKLEFAVEERERVNIPVWLGVAAVVGGTVLLLVDGRKS